MSHRPVPCECGGTLVPSLRYGSTTRPVETLCCFDCGYETPRLRCCRVAPGQSRALVVRICGWCRQPFERRPSDDDRYCGYLCGGRAAAASSARGVDGHFLPRRAS